MAMTEARVVVILFSGFIFYENTERWKTRTTFGLGLRLNRCNK
jgi:hypothetical protein